MANRVPTLLATAVATACSLSAHASGPTQADYAKIVLYSNVTIAQDSVNQWGLWEELEPPAAGPEVPLRLLGAGTNDAYRPLGSVEVPQPGACTSGGLCGFGVIYALGGSTPNSPNQSLMLMPGSAQAAGGNAWLPGSFELSTTSVRDTSGFTGYAGVGPLVLDGNQTHALVGQGGNRLVTNLGTVAARVGANSTLDHFNGQLSNYVSGGPSAPAGTGVVYGVWGVTTTAQGMNTLQASGATASYSGAVLNQSGGQNGTMSMSVNFGAGSFTASFNNVGNGQQYSGQPTASTVSFNVTQGQINGSLFSATQLSPNVFGKVEGAFFGANAATAGGVLDVTSTTALSAGSTPGLPRFVAPFAAARQP